MNIQDIDPAIVAEVRGNGEPVIAETVAGYKAGIRSRSIYGIGTCLGTLTITNDGEVYHSLAGSVPVYNVRELDEIIAKREMQLATLREARALY